MSCVEIFINCMVKKIQGTISSKSATLYLHTFNLYWRILGFQEEKQNQFWNINHTLRRKQNLEIKIILTYSILTFIHNTHKQG